MIDADFLGTPFGGTCMFNLGLFNQLSPQFPYNWFWQGGLGVSALRNLGSHALHLLWHLFGPLDALVAFSRKLLTEWRFPDAEVLKPPPTEVAQLLLPSDSGITINQPGS